jgi:ABC-type Fe3+-hydroxamate transport system substrate-binding protein
MRVSVALTDSSSSLLALMVRHLLLALLTVLVVAGCGPSSSGDAGNTVVDDLDREVSIDRPVERVVSLAPNLTELAYAAGAGSSLVAVTSSCDYPPPVDTLPHVSALPVDFEAIVAKKPDLVLATDQINAPNDTGTFEALDVPIYFFSFDTLGDVVEGIRTMGRLLGTEAAAADSAAALQQNIEALRARTESIPPDQRPRVLVLVGDATLYSFGRGSYVHTLVELAGGRSITSDIDDQAPTLSNEYVLTEKPDVILGLWGSDYDSSRLLKLHPTWDIVPALQNDRVYSLPTALIGRPAPRVVEGARRLAHLLHPTLVPAPSSSSPSPAKSGS